MSPAGPVRLASPSELAVQLNANGSIRRIERAHRLERSVRLDASV